MSDPSPFREPSDEVKTLVDELSERMAVRGVSTRKIRQFWSLAMCCAAAKTYERGERKVEIEDVREAYELLKPWLRGVA
jgi:hypothetical protein